MSVNSVRYARVARFDKVRILYPAMEWDHAKVMHNGLLQSLNHLYGWSEEYARRHCKIEPFWVRGERAGYYLQLTWKACELAYTLRFSHAHNCTEIEVKGYLCESDNDASLYYKFCDTVYANKGSLNTYIMINGTRTSKNKGGSDRSPKIGSNKSGVQAGPYRRQGEKTGLEVAVRKSRLKRAVQSVVTNLENVEGDGTDRHRWDALMRTCARIGFAEWEAELTRRGIRLRDYFEAFSTDEHGMRRDGDNELSIGENGAAIVQQELFGRENA